MNDKYHPQSSAPAVHGLQIVESTALPGGGLLLAWSTYRYSEKYRDAASPRYLIDQYGIADETTLDRWPDLRRDEDWWGRRDGDEALADALRVELREIEASGGVLAVWDAPVLFERLRRYGIEPPERLLDLKILHEIRFPDWNGRRSLVGMARALRVRGVNVTRFRPRGLEAESRLALVCGRILLEHMYAEGWDLPGLRELQALRAAGLEEDLRERWVAHGRPLRALRTGWPRWDSRAED